MTILSRFNMAAAGRDLIGFIRMRRRSEFAAAAIALLITGWILYALDQDSYAVIQPQIIYVESWPTTRTDDEIKAEQKIDAAAQKKALDARTAEFRKIADAFGIKY